MRSFFAAMLFGFALLATRGLHAGSVVNSKHNLGMRGPGEIKADDDARVCAFCHVPHTPKAPRAMWARPMNDTLYVPYESSTMKSKVGQPNGATRLCLSCHDGTVALGIVGNRRNVPMRGVSLGGLMPPGRSNLGTDLRTTHPVSMPLPVDGLKVKPPTGRGARLDGEGLVQCTSCHDPHSDDRDARVRKFLAQDNAYSEMCRECHTLRSWDSGLTAHQSSEKRFSPEQGNPTPYLTVAETGCESCHRSHHAAVGPRLLLAPDNETCRNCHAGQVADVDVFRDFDKPYAHKVSVGGRSVHDAAEGPDNQRQPLPERSLAAERHVVCVDCHDPHAANNKKARPPFASGALEDVWGIDSSGRKVEHVQYEYEVCFKCHGDSVNKPSQAGFGVLRQVRRQVDESNLRLAFDPSGPSSHPVVTPSRSLGVPGLIGGMSPGAQIYCSDCHGSDSGSGAPHGSIYPYMLERSYSTEDPTIESPLAYALCYKCHDRNVLFSDQSRFPEHRRHVVGENTSCSVCHTAHGISLMGGDPSGNAHLVNFDVGVVQPFRGELRYESFGIQAGRCTLTCHGSNHAGATYGMP